MRLTSDSSQRKADIDGLFMLFISSAFIFATLGISLFVLIIRVILRARLSDDSMQDSPLCLFGYQLSNNKVAPILQERLDYLLQTSSKNNMLILLLGGITKGNTIAEAKAAFDYLIEVKPSLESRLRIEDKSRNTLENLKQARKSLDKELKDFDGKIVLVTHDYHLLRCEAMAKALGFYPYSAGCKTNSKLSFNFIFKVIGEAFFIHWFYTGYFIGKLFSSKRILEKIT